ncbi:Pericentrin [Frankliniella fusca]|uniref:Pericentrin n=1 Tax=Frankliniella fusca TaxID=407009 RepID=A0AAE1GZ36_9NEOP|nr:Pericentrin [Frankliniella fusca]
MERLLKPDKNNPAAGEVIAGFEEEDETSQISQPKAKTKNAKDSDGTLESTNQSSKYSTADEDPPDGKSSSNGVAESSIVNGCGENVSELLNDRIRHLEDLLAGKEAMLLAVTQELEAVREMSCIDASIGPLTSGLDVDYKASIAEYNRKLQEHASALRQRDEYINKLAESLKQSVRDREELKKEAKQLADQVHTLQTQLKAVKQQMQQPQTKLLEALKEKENQLQKKTSELSLCKAQSSKEVQFLMSSLEELQQRAARSASASPPTSKTKEESDLKVYNNLKLQYETDMKSLTKQVAAAVEIETFLRQQLSDAKKECESLNLELSSLKLTHETHLTVCRDQHELVSSESIAESEKILKEKLHLAEKELQGSKKRALELENEIKVLSIQYDEKNEVCKMQGDKLQLLQSQTQEYATDIATCHQTLEQYKKRIDELQAKHSEDVIHVEANLSTEVMRLNQCISDLQEAHRQQLHSMHQDLNRMKQRQMEELAMKQLSHENEINTIKRDAEKYRTELREKNNLLSIQEQQLEEERRWIRTFSQQVQELGGKLNEEEDKNEEYREKIEYLKQQLKERDQACTLHLPQIEFLHQQLKDERQKSTNMLQQLEDVRKQLLLEQEMCKAYSVRMEDANSDIRDLQTKNSEAKAQYLKLDESSKLNMNADQQKMNSLQSEILSMREQLSREQKQVQFYRVENEDLKKQLKSLSVLQNDFKNLQMVLESEKETSTKCRNEIISLKEELDQQKIKYNEEYKKLLSLSQLGTSSLEAEEENSKEPLSDQAVAVSLQLNIKVLQDTIMNLKKEREESEAQMEVLKEHLRIAKEDFENCLCQLRDELSKKDLELQELQKLSVEITMQKSEIESYNVQVKELISDKKALEDELSLQKKKYEEEILSLTSQVMELQCNLESSLLSSEDETKTILLKKCRDDIQILRSVNLQKDCAPVPGLITLEKLINLCEVSSPDEKQTENLRENIVSQLAKLSYINEKLEEELIVCKKEHHNLQMKFKKFLTSAETVGEKKEIISEQEQEEKLYPSSSADSKGLPISVVSRVSDHVAHWFKRCEDLEKNNLELKMTVQELQAQLFESVSKSNCHSSSLIQAIDKFKAKCTCESVFSKERNTLKNSIEMLRKELVEKETEYFESKLKAKRRKSKHLPQACDDIDCVANLINDLSCIGKEKIMLESELKKTKLECEFFSLENNRLAEHVERAHELLEESWKGQITLESDLSNSIKENSIVRARLTRLETFYEFMKQKSRAPTDLVWQLIQELSSPAVDKKQLNKNSKKSIVLEKLESVISIISKMYSDCEALIVKLQSEDEKSQSGYLQSEALGLRRLQTALLETQQAVLSRSEPALQLHVDLLNKQLEDRQVAYEDICEAHYSLEAEMREMEKRFQHQEQRMQEELCKQMALCKLWKLKAQAVQVQTQASQFAHFNHYGNISHVVEEMESVYSKVFSTLRAETERIATVRENKVRLEMSEKLCAAEKKFRQQYDDLEKRVKNESNVRALQVLHQQEIDVVRAECDLLRIKEIHKLQEQTPSFFTQPHIVDPHSSCSNLSMLFMKHHVVTQYNNALQQVSASLQNELAKHFSLLEESLKKSVTSNDQELEILVPNSDCIDQFEQVVSNVQESVKKLLEMQTLGLQSILSICESNHKSMIEKVQDMTSEFGTVCASKSLCDELMKAKEEHRYTIESMSAAHKAEVSRLRLLLTQQNLGETSEPNETALSVLQRELEEKHKKQMEELRTYFEQKCADFEKHYSEEVFSQHSRKLSDCSSASESELVSEMYYAGPGSSNCSIPGAPSHFCDLLGESSFKDLEEQAGTMDVEKLLIENREQLETLRLALESRHQGELEAQKELFEGRVEELLRNMSDRHASELKLQSIHLQELKAKESELTKKLLEAQNEAECLKQQLSSSQKEGNNSLSRCSVNEQQIHLNQEKVQQYDKQTQSDFEDELKKMADVLKRRDSENSAQIATLKTKLRQNQEIMSKLEKDMSNLRSKHECDLQSLTSSNEEKIAKIQELNEEIRALSMRLEECNLQKENAESQYNSLKEKFESQLQIKDKEFEIKIKTLNCAPNEKRETNDAEEKNLQDIINKSVEERKALLEAEYTEYLEFVKKCADETKMQLVMKHESELKQVIDKYEKELTSVRDSSKDCGILVGKSCFKNILETDCSEKESSLQACLQELLKLTEELVGGQQDQFEKVVLKLCKEVDHYQQILHQDLEMKLESVQEDSERRFQLQLVEARGDIVQALEKQIQLLLDDNTSADDKPPELQQLEKKFASKYNEKLTNLQKDYEAKISELSSKHATQLSLARSKKQTKLPSITAEDLEKLYKERDCLRSVAATLRDVVAELVKYFVSWEDDFNSTLMDELVKLEAERDKDDMLSVTQQDQSIVFNQSHDVNQSNSITSEDEMPLIVATPARGRHLSSCVKRVHFAPDVSGILSLIDDGSLFESVGLNCSVRDTSLNFQEELDRCLARLRSDSAALYALSKPALPSVSTNQPSCNVSTEERSLEDLPGKLSEALETIAQLRKEKEELRNQLLVLSEEQEKSFVELQATRQRLDCLEQEARQQAEVVAEGYGEGEQSMTCDVPSSPRATTVEELQNKARSLLLGTSNTEDMSGVLSPNTSQHLPHIVEELCRDWERLAEESRHKQDDLQQQVEAVDKQLRATRAFMDEQAAEREQERDDYVEEIRRLQELVRDKDRDRSSHQQMNHESTREICMHLKHLGTSISVETLEVQLKESQASLQDKQEKLEKLNAEHKQAVEKIWTLRDIISDLEVQVATKAEEAASLSAQNEALRQMVEQQGRTQLELAQEMEQLQLCANDGTLLERISQLEEQLCKHRTLVEQLGDPSFIEQMKTQLQDLNASLDLHTKELECAYINSTLPASPCLSSPSEDVSVRETIEAIRAAAEKDATQKTESSLVLPFNEVSRVVDQWQRHARADDAVLKKLRELDMQLDDLQAEKETLSNRLQDQMLLSSSLQAKLEDHRRKADVKLAEATSEKDSQIEDLRSEIHNYSETLEAREKQVESLKASLCRAENELRHREAEIMSNAELEHSIAAQLQSQISKLSADKNKLQTLLAEKNDMHASIPALVESMLLDKNDDIDRLEQQIHHLTKQMELSSHYVVTPSTTLEFEYCESEKVRAHVALSPVMELRRSLPLPVIDESTIVKSVVQRNDTPLSFTTSQTLENNGGELHQETDVSLKPIPQEDTMMQSSPHSQQSSNSLSASDTMSSNPGTFDTSLASCEKRVASLELELDAKTKEIEDLTKKLNDNDNLISELHQKCKQLEECEKKLSAMSKLKEECNRLKKSYEEKVNEVSELKEHLKSIQSTYLEVCDQGVALPGKPEQDTSELKAKESEIQRLRSEVCATQAILTNLQRKVQEAKQIARSPSRSSPENNQALRIVQNELEAAKLEIVELKDLCKSIKSEMEEEYHFKQSDFENILHREQQAKQTLLETLDKLQKENSPTQLNKIQTDLNDAKTSIMKKEEENNLLRRELKQLNMECIALKNQLSTPLREATSLASKLDAEKKFADALKEELLLFKNRASSLDEECKSLKDTVKNLQKIERDGQTEENEKYLKEILELKRCVDDLMQERISLQNQLGKFSHENTVLKEENFEICKELSDMKQLIIELRGVKAPREETQRALLSKNNELSEMKKQNSALSAELSSLRKALKNIHSNLQEAYGLAEEDRLTLQKLQRQVHRPDLTGAGDGLCSKLTLSEIDIHEVPSNTAPLKESESLDDLTGLVQHELHVSVQLDHSLLQTIDPENSKMSPSSLPVNEQTQSENDFIKNTKVEPRLSQEAIAAQHRICQLEDELGKLKNALQLLNNQLENERAQYYSLQQQDCELIKEMRVKLSEALDGQHSLRLQLQSERNKRRSADVKEAQAPVSSNSSPAGHHSGVEKLRGQCYDATPELMKLRLEKEAAEKQLRRMQEAEIQRSRRRAVTEEKYRKQITHLETLHAETQEECIRLRQELAVVNQKLSLAQEEFAKDRDTHLKNHAPFVERMKNMNTFLGEHIEENIRMAKQMEDLTEEHRKLRQRIAQLEGQLGDKRSNESFEAVNARFVAEKANWEAEQKVLLLALSEAKQRQILCSDSDIEERVSHLFGRYLRMQSYRKALVWQKRYLLSVIRGLNESKLLASSHLAALAESNKVLKWNPLRKFRSIVMMVMAVHRMQYMVQRWFRGRRIGCGVVVQQTVAHCAFSTSSFPQGHHGTLFSGSNMPAHDMRSGLSQSPPTLERPRQSQSQQLASSHFSRLPLNSRGPSNSLSECVTNFNLVQQRFDALLSNPPK